MKVGARVKYIREDTVEDKATGMYPPIDTFGTVVDVESDCYKVQWDEGTRNGVWFVNRSDVEFVYHPSINGDVEAIRIFLGEDGHTPKAELTFAYGGTAVICWIHSHERKNYAAGINGYTYIYDERPKKEFFKWIKK